MEHNHKITIFRKQAVIIIALFFVIVGQNLYAQIEPFDNPIAEKRADPWVHKADDGTYYFIATAPEYDRIIMRKASSINGLKNATEKVIWWKHASGEMSAHIWAPELHRIDGKWYIYFAAGEADDVWKIRIFALSNASDDPMEGEWTEEGRIVTQTSSFSLDATTFEHNGKRYLIWAQTKGDGTGLFLCEMATPTTLTGPEVVITVPDLSWERIGHNVNEGAAVIKRNGKLFVAYSASATDFNYCMGLMWIDENADLLNVSNWHKSQTPVFYTNESVKRFGPGHNSFTVAEDGKTDILIYHCRDYKEINGEPLNDPNRATRARVLHWTEDGFPDFMQDAEDNATIIDCNGTIQGTAYVDNCDICVGGTTGKEPCPPLPEISADLTNIEAEAGTPVVFQIEATEAGTLSYQWYFNETKIDGAKEASYTIESASEINVGEYFVVVSNETGSVQSAKASLSLIAQPISFPLKKGWNLIAYPFKESQEISDALSEIWEYVHIVKNMDSFYDKTQNPALNLLKSLQWSQGYFVKVNEDCVLTW